MKPTSTKLILTEYKAEMILGILPNERLKPQPVIFNVEVTLNLTAAQLSGDAIEQVFNYQYIIDAIEALVHTPFNLQESLCQKIAQTIVKLQRAHAPHSPISHLRIRSSKPMAYENAQSISAELCFTAPFDA